MKVLACRSRISLGSSIRSIVSNPTATARPEVPVWGLRSHEEPWNYIAEPFRPGTLRPVCWWKSNCRSKADAALNHRQMSGRASQREGFLDSRDLLGRKLQLFRVLRNVIRVRRLG